MAKTNKKQTIVDPQNLPQRDKDILSMEVKDLMKKYKMERQAIYDRRHALKKKLEGAKQPVEQPASSKPAAKRGRPKKEQAVTDAAAESRELMVIQDKNLPVIMKPIEIKFDNFTVKLNGVPKKISVNPDTHAIEIDL